MKHSHDTNHMSPKTRESTFPEKLCIDGTLNEQFIIDLHQLFLRYDWSSLCVDSLQQGRGLIYTGLDSLRCYYHPACITLEKQPLRSTITDLVQTLEFNNTTNKQEAIRELFITHVEYDFIWIEQSKTLASKRWFKQLKHSIKALNLSDHMPIITVYTNHTV